MKRTNLTPRSDHVGRELTVPHEGLYRAMRGFLGDLEAAERAYREEVAAIRENMGIPAQYMETTDVERYSLAVQLFAAVTIEAVISFYAVLRFGGGKHDEHFRWDKAHKRLQKALAHAGIPLKDDAEILKVVQSVMEARHRIAHPFTVEYSGSEQATIQQPDRPGPDETAAAAREAVGSVDRFLELLRQLDEPHSHYFTIY
jgi:hypothetical protein